MPLERSSARPFAARSWIGKAIGKAIGKFSRATPKIDDNMPSLRLLEIGNPMSVSAMEPMVPIGGPADEELYARSIALDRASAALAASMNPIVRSAIALRVRSMNSYYSNFIEGRVTHPADIERALGGDYSTEPHRAELQYEAGAHVHVQVEVEKRLREDPAVNVASADFLSWLHRAFYEQMPEEYRVVRDARGEPVRGKSGPVRVQGGAFRKQDVIIGRHQPPEWKSLAPFLKRFEEVYDPDHVEPHLRIVAACAAHHRFAWIHPFIDGNGRVVRLFTDAYFIRIGLGALPLWTLSRGLARRRDEYMAMLTWADAGRRNDLDGRGNLSLEGLQRFCLFMLETAIDQVSFMSGLFDLDNLERRIDAFVHRLAADGELRPEATRILSAALRFGQITRGDAVRYSGLGERIGRDLVKALLGAGLLETDSSKGPVRLGLPARALPYYLPGLYPPQIEEDLRELPTPKPKAD